MSTCIVCVWTIAAVALATMAPAAANGCTSDTFVVAGTSLVVEVCAPAARGTSKGPLVATETLSVRGQPPLVRNVTLDIVATTDATHAIDDAPLQSLGIAGTLHATLGYRAGAVRLEHALLVPGAIALK
ncbi:MAG: hypothetical protein NVS2B8_11830 [Vulcanimicrobiaceae bacterium]